MSRKWSVFGIVAAAFAISAVGLSIAADDEEGPVHKTMEKVGKKNTALKKALCNPASYKKAAKEIGDNGEELVKLFKGVRAEKDPAKTAKKPQAVWESAVNEMLKSAEEFNKVADGGKGKLADAKAAYAVMNAKCSACHKVFKIEEDE